MSEGGREREGATDTGSLGGPAAATGRTGGDTAGKHGG